MAGIPNYFFPTDYLYPRAAASTAADIASKAALLPAGPVQALKIDASPIKSVDGVRISSSSSASTVSALVMSESDIQKELRRGTPVVADPRNSDDDEDDA